MPPIARPGETFDLIACTGGVGDDLGVKLGTIQTAVVSELGTLALLALPIGGLLARRRPH